VIPALNKEEREHLAKCGVPDEMMDQIESLFDELNGAIVADGWSDPAGQARFVAERLECHAAAFRDQAAIYLVRIGAHRG